MPSPAWAQTAAPFRYVALALCDFVGTAHENPNVQIAVAASAKTRQTLVTQTQLRIVLGARRHLGGDRCIERWHRTLGPQHCIGNAA